MSSGCSDLSPPRPVQRKPPDDQADQFLRRPIGVFDVLTDQTLSIPTLLRAFRGKVVLTWGLTLGETGLMALIPLFTGLAIDGLLAGTLQEFWLLSGLLAMLVVLSVLRRVYDTRVYSAIRVELGVAQVGRGAELAVSALNARVGMGRELVEFLEETLPMVMASVVQLAVSVIILFSFAPMLAGSAILSVFGLMALYALFHRRFFRLNGLLNQQIERQVSILQRRRPEHVLGHLKRLRRREVQLSDTEAILYGLIFVVLLAMILFNLWYGTTNLALSIGAIFAVISYSWEFIDSALALPLTLQHWSRLSEITGRLNQSAARPAPSVARD